MKTLFSGKSSEFPYCVFFLKYGRFSQIFATSGGGGGGCSPKSPPLTPLTTSSFFLFGVGYINNTIESTWC